jgi:hypothetical protein
MRKFFCLHKRYNEFLIAKETNIGLFNVEGILGGWLADVEYEWIDTEYHLYKWNKYFELLYG